MNRESMHRCLISAPLAAATLLFALAGPASGQVPVDDAGNRLGPLDSGVEIENPATGDIVLLEHSELEELVGPVALYPDDLLAIVLPASTYPLEIVQAARFLDNVERDPSLKPDPEWDDSVVALLNYPEVLRMMNEDIDWTWRLGEAVVAQQADVIDAVESFRGQAYAAGNLKSDEHQRVAVNDDVIEIDPVEDDVIYVPYYEPERVLVYSPQPVYYYYPRPYPVYYYPYPAGHYFTAGYFWGVTTAFQIGWWDDYLHVHHHSYRSHPYYGHYYYGSYWRQPTLYVHNSYYVNNHVYVSQDRHHYGDYWRPRHRGGARPVHTVARDTYYSDRRAPRANTRDGYYNDDGVRQPSSVAGTSAYRDSRVRNRDAASTDARTARRSATDARARNTVNRRETALQESARRSAGNTRDGRTERAVTAERQTRTAATNRGSRVERAPTPARTRNEVQASQRRTVSTPKRATEFKSQRTARAAPARIETRASSPSRGADRRSERQAQIQRAPRTTTPTPQRVMRSEAPRTKASAPRQPAQRVAPPRQVERRSTPPRGESTKRQAGGASERSSGRGSRESRSRPDRDRN